MTETAAKSASLADYANPTRFLALAQSMIAPLWAATLLVGATGLWLSLNAPEDYQQGASVTIMFVHVPAAWLSMMIYTVMSISALGVLVWRHPLAEVSLRSAAPLGAAFTFLALVTGSLWGKPMWGTWWVWDARLTSVLVLLIVYLGIIALARAIENPAVSARSTAIVTLVGFINIPIIKYSVDWWNTLHQPASVSRFARPAMDAAYLYPLLAMALAYTLVFAALQLMAMRNEILSRRLRSLKLAAARSVQKG